MQAVNSCVFNYTMISVFWNLFRGIYGGKKRIGLLFLLIAVVVGGGGYCWRKKPYIKRRIQHFAFPPLDE